jgi:glycosyltransferase involved in cell wall biosynthesis
LIHAHAALPCGHAAALIKQDLGIPFVVSVHGRDVFSARARGVAAQWRERVSKLVYQSADRVICVSGKVEDEIARAVQCHSSIIYNGVDPELFYPEPSGSVTDPIVLSVGNLIPSKGHDILLKSIAAIASRHPLVHCRIVGDGPDRRRLEKLANELGISERVRFMGRRSHAAVAALMRACAVFVLSSWYEALGCAYLEAMACAKPVIGCFGQGIAEIIHTGHNGWIVAPNDVEELSHALDSLLHDRNLRAQLGTEARRTILAGFTLQHQAKRLVQTYEECAN